MFWFFLLGLSAVNNGNQIFVKINTCREDENIFVNMTIFLCCMTYTSLVLLTNSIDNSAEQKIQQNITFITGEIQRENEISIYKYSRSMRYFSFYPWQTSFKKFLCVAITIL